MLIPSFSVVLRRVAQFFLESNFREHHSLNGLYLPGCRFYDHSVPWSVVCTKIVVYRLCFIWSGGIQFVESHSKNSSLVQEDPPWVSTISPKLRMIQWSVDYFKYGYEVDLTTPDSKSVQEVHGELRGYQGQVHLLDSLYPSLFEKIHGSVTVSSFLKRSQESIRPHCRLFLNC